MTIVIAITAKLGGVGDAEVVEVENLPVTEETALGALIASPRDQGQSNDSSSTRPVMLSADNDEYFANPDIPLSAELQEYVFVTCSEYGVPHDEFLAMMWRESRFQEDAVGFNANGTTDVGICQINTVTLPFFQERGIDPYASPRDNITAACTLYAYYRYELDCTPLEAWAAYGAGYGGMRAGNGFAAARRLIEGGEPWNVQPT